jgi:type II secretory pathway component PulC
MFEEVISLLFTTEQGRRIGLVVLAIVGILLLYTVVDTVQTWYGDVLVLRQPKVVIVPHVKNDAQQLLLELPKRHLFGQSFAANSAFLPITSLRLHLTGITKMPQDQFSHVIIAEADKPGKVYRVGDLLLTGIRIHAIEQNEVILERDGQLEKLPLVRTSLIFQKAAKSLWE